MAIGPQKVQIRRTSTPNSPPTGLSPGELAIEMAEPTRLWVGVPATLDVAEKKLLTQPPAVVASDTPPANPQKNLIWFESSTGALWIWYHDADSQQWVQVNTANPALPPQEAEDIVFEPGGSLSADDVQEALLELDSEKVAKAGDIMTGYLVLVGSPTDELHPATKFYTDAADVVLQTQIDTKIGDAPSDGQLYGRKSGAWSVAAPIDSPPFTGNPTAPTPAPGDNDTSIATTAFVKAAIAAAGASAGIPIAFPFTGKPATGVKVNVPVAIASTIPASLTGSLAFASTATTADAVFTVNKISGGSTTALGTITMKASGTHTFAGAGGALAIGDVLQVVSPGTQDATLADVGITIMTQRG